MPSRRAPSSASSAPRPGENAAPPDRPHVTIVEAADRASALAAIAAGFPLPTVLLLDDLAPDVARAALAAGAVAVISRAVEAAELDAVVQAVAAGFLVLDPALREPADRDAAPPNDALTAREGEVLRMLARGLSNRRIAETLQIAENTVKAHVASILAKLDAESRTEAVTIGIRRGYLML